MVIRGVNRTINNGDVYVKRVMEQDSGEVQERYLLYKSKKERKGEGG